MTRWLTEFIRPSRRSLLNEWMSKLTPVDLDCILPRGHDPLLRKWPAKAGPVRNETPHQLGRFFLPVGVIVKHVYLARGQRLRREVDAKMYQFLPD